MKKMKTATEEPFTSIGKHNMRISVQVEPGLAIVEIQQRFGQTHLQTKNVSIESFSELVSERRSELRQREK